MEEQEPKPKRLPRVSLLNLLLLVALVASLLSHATLVRDLSRARAELRSLRNEVGALTITDGRKPHAIQLDTGDPNHWKWRVRVPDGRRYSLRFVHGGVPLTGLPAASEELTRLGPGEHTVEYDVKREETREAWTATVQTARAIDTTRVLWGEPRWYIVRGVGRETRDFPADDPAVLWRLRASNEKNPNSLAGPTDGFMIWLEPLP